ncbi:MAG: hypothetical protein ACLQKA_09685 [Bryobacteraceae bacterium]
MGEIRAFADDHAAGAASLYLRAIRGKKLPPGDDLKRHLAELFLSNP